MLRSRKNGLGEEKGQGSRRCAGRPKASRRCRGQPPGAVPRNFSLLFSRYAQCNQKDNLSQPTWSLLAPLLSSPTSNPSSGRDIQRNPEHPSSPHSRLEAGKRDAARYCYYVFDPCTQSVSPLLATSPLPSALVHPTPPLSRNSIRHPTRIASISLQPSLLILSILSDQSFFIRGCLCPHTHTHQRSTRAQFPPNEKEIPSVL